jgi:signal transduction histidine kinase
MHDVKPPRWLEDRVAARTAELAAKNEEVKAMTQQLWQTAKLASVGELAASVAHELNNPLATVSLRIEALLAGTSRDSPTYRPLEIVDGEVERMGKLVARLLEFSRNNDAQVTTVDMPSEIDNALELVANHLRNRNVVADTDYGAGRLMVHADRQQLRQVLLNLITNACDAMEGGGGTLTIRVRREDVEPVAEPATEDAPRPPSIVIMDVIDTGSGIKPEVLPRILEPFFTTKPEGKGTGLGLAICRRIVQEHGGKLEVKSELGRGTTFRVTLPASDNGSAHVDE